jgi:hypothetical protein
METLKFGVETYNRNNEAILIAQFDNIDDACIFAYTKAVNLSDKEYSKVWIIDNEANIVEEWHVC